MKIYFVRHGESVANVDHEVSNRGWRHPLTETGRQQAAQLAENLLAVGAVKIDTSPLMRAVQTAEIVAQRLGMGCEVTDALREYDCGIIEGRADEEAWRLHRWARDEWFEHDRLDARIEGGESFNDMRRRFVPFVEGLVRAYGETGASLILVGHGGLYNCMLPLVLTNIARETVVWHGFPNTGYVLAERRPEGLVCVSWCGTAI